MSDLTSSISLLAAEIGHDVGSHNNRITHLEAEVYALALNSDPDGVTEQAGWWGEALPPIPEELNTGDQLDDSCVPPEIPRYPCTLPCALVDGYGYKPEPRAIRTQMESGRARHRRTTRHAPKRFNLKFLYQGHQMQVFESWYEHDANVGVSWFAITLQTGAELSWHIARAIPGEEYQAALLGGQVYEVSMPVEVREIPLYPADCMDIVRTMPLNTLYQSTNVMHRAVHSTLAGAFHV